MLDPVVDDCWVFPNKLVAGFDCAVEVVLPKRLGVAVVPDAAVDVF
jgi:hypothetical protein